MGRFYCAKNHAGISCLHLLHWNGRRTVMFRSAKLPGSNKAKDALIEFEIIHGLILSARVRNGAYLTHTEVGSPFDFIVNYWLTGIISNYEPSEITAERLKVVAERPIGW